VVTARLTWADLQLVIETAEAPRVMRFDGQPVIHLVFDPSRKELAVRLPRGNSDVPASPLSLLRISQRLLDSGAIIEISTSTPALFPYFHSFAVAVSDRVQIDGLDSHAALTECLDRWRDLFKEIAKLSPEQQLGLLGELWLLRRLMSHKGHRAALDAWTGPTGQAHDFRFGAVEIEVKATTNEHRVHIISSDTQLTASNGAELYVVSLQYTAAGAGSSDSLGNAIEDTRTILAGHDQSNRFDSILNDHFRLTPSDLALYRTPLKLRTAPCLVPVDERFPRIRLADLADATDIARVSDVHYRVNLEGLGDLLGTDRFVDVLGDEA
jgi:hypothetical protein